MPISLKNLFEDTLNSLNNAVWRTNRRSAFIDFGFNTLSLIGYGGILFLLVKYLLDGEISVGAFAAVYASIGGLFGMMDNIINHNIGNLANNFGLIRNYLRFLDIPSDNRANIKISKKNGITIENVSFTYPNADEQSLKNIDLAIKPGETIAIVGENGAGKTTLVKLLTGLYKPTKGTVKIGETSANTISYRSLFECVSGVFQKYQRYALTLKEKTAVIVTHRLGSAKIAERIVVMKNGEIAEIGSHDELLNSGGIYAEMYAAQAEWYN